MIKDLKKSRITMLFFPSVKTSSSRITTGTKSKEQKCVTFGWEDGQGLLH